MRPGAAHQRPGHGSSRCRCRRAAHAHCRDNDNGRAVIARGGRFLPPRQRFVEGRRVARLLELDGGRLRQEPRLVNERIDARLHQIRAHVEEQEQAAEQEEDNDQQDRDEPDEDVGERELPAHAPEESLPHVCMVRFHTVKLRETARFSTVCIHAGQVPDPSTGAIITPIYQTSTYVQEALGKHKGYEYARTQNPTRSALEANIAAIENGTAAFAFASGMAATGAVMTLLKAGDHVVVTDNTYGGTYRLFERVLRKYQLDFTYVDTSKTDEIARAIRPNTKMLFLETPTNPTLRLTDLRAACEVAHARGVFVVVDNTFASPYVQR